MLYPKSIAENATETEKRDLINELRIMTTVGEHPNVISLIGACTEKGKCRLKNYSDVHRFFKDYFKYSQLTLALQTPRYYGNPEIRTAVESPEKINYRRLTKSPLLRTLATN